MDRALHQEVTMSQGFATGESDIPVGNVPCFRMSHSVPVDKRRLSA